MQKFISNVSAKMYTKMTKPILFRFDPEKVHNATVSATHIAGNIPLIPWYTKAFFNYQDTILMQKIDGISYKNPVGLAAGWDKDAKAISFMSALGFGFTEVGSITQYAYDGNEGIRLWRYPKSKSILVYYGLKNEGVDLIAPRIKTSNSAIPVGTNIARTNSPQCDDDSSIRDYAYSFKKLRNIGDYFTVNISCPNTFGGQPFHDKKRLGLLLTALDNIPTKKPVYIKLSPDISRQERLDIAALSFKHRVDGFICGNLTKNRSLTAIKENIEPDVGGLSGKVVEALSNQLIADMYQFTKGKKTIIGLGGVFNGDDAYQKITLGANLVQLITGLIYQGPQTVGQINQRLATLLNEHGHSSVSQAVGVNNPIS